MEDEKKLQMIQSRRKLRLFFINEYIKNADFISIFFVVFTSLNSVVNYL